MRPRVASLGDPAYQTTLREHRSGGWMTSLGSDEDPIGSAPSSSFTTNKTLMPTGATMPPRRGAQPGAGRFTDKRLSAFDPR
jgi:hypothetical protein